MAELQLSGFEEQDAACGIWTVNGAGATFSNTLAHSGTWSGKIFPSGSVATNFQRTTVSTTTGSIMARFYIYIVSYGSVIDPTIFETVSNTNQQSLIVRLMRTGALRLENLTPGSAGPVTTSTILSLTTWYRIETKHDIAESPNGAVHLKLFLGESTTELELIEILAEDTLNVNNSSYFFGQRTNPSATCTFYLDDIKINDDSGSVSNNYAGPGNTAIMTANGDTSITWTQAGGAGSNFGGVDDIPGTVNDADYNFDTTATNEEKLSMTALDVPSNATLKNMSVYARVSLSAAGGTHRFVMRVWNESGTGTDGPFVQPTIDTPVRIVTPAEHFPYDLAGKTKANLDDFSLGYRSTVGTVTQKRIHSIWANVEWTAGVSGEADVEDLMGAMVGM